MYTALVVLPEDQIEAAKKALEGRRFEVFTATNPKDAARLLLARPHLAFIAKEFEREMELAIDRKFTTPIVCYSGVQNGDALRAALEEVGLPWGLDAIS